MIAAGLAAAVAWNTLTWRLGLPSSSGHALVGGLAGAALAAGGVDAVRWGGSTDGGPSASRGPSWRWRSRRCSAPRPRWSRFVACVMEGGAPTRRWREPLRGGERCTAGALGIQPRRQRRAEIRRRHGGAVGGLGRPAAARPTELICAAALTAGTALGGWRIVRTVGRRIYRLGALDGLSGQSASAAVIFGASPTRANG